MTIRKRSLTLAGILSLTTTSAFADTLEVVLISTATPPTVKLTDLSTGALPKGNQLGCTAQYEIDYKAFKRIRQSQRSLWIDVAGGGGGGASGRVSSDKAGGGGGGGSLAAKTGPLIFKKDERIRIKLGCGGDGGVGAVDGSADKGNGQTGGPTVVELVDRFGVPVEEIVVNRDGSRSKKKKLSLEVPGGAGGKIASGKTGGAGGDGHNSGGNGGSGGDNLDKPDAKAAQAGKPNALGARNGGLGGKSHSGNRTGGGGGGGFALGTAGCGATWGSQLPPEACSTTHRGDKDPHTATVGVNGSGGGGGRASHNDSADGMYMHGAKGGDGAVKITVD